jgi:hypothetical protein
MVHACACPSVPRGRRLATIGGPDHRAGPRPFATLGNRAHQSNHAINQHIMRCAHARAAERRGGGCGGGAVAGLVVHWYTSPLPKETLAVAPTRPCQPEGLWCSCGRETWGRLRHPHLETGAATHRQRTERESGGEGWGCVMCMAARVE